MHLSYFAEQIRRFDNDRYLCSLFAPVEQREMLFALYSFNIEIARIPEMVSEEITGLIRLEWWHEAIIGLFQGKVRNHVVIRALASIINKYPLEEKYFTTLIKAREDDILKKQPATLEEYKDYAQLSSAPLLLLANQIIGNNDSQTQQALTHLATGWAMLGMVRSLTHKYHLGRNIIPLNLIAQEQLSSVIIDSPAMRNIIKQIIDETELELGYSDNLQITFNLYPLFLIKQIAIIIITRIRNNNYNIYTKTIEANKTILLLKMLTKVFFGKIN